MNRARVVSTALVVSSLCAAIPVAAQAPTPTPAEGWMVLPVEEYRALRERAIPPAPPPPALPVDATLTRVDYDLRVDGESIAGRALLMIDVLKTGWTRVQIPAGLMVRDAPSGARDGAGSPAAFAPWRSGEPRRSSRVLYASGGGKGCATTIVRRTRQE